MIKIYLAARYSRIDEINEYANQLRKAGYQVDARWLLGNHQIHGGVDKVEGATVSVPMEGQTFALDDVADLQDAEVVISFTESPRSTYGRGGRHVEFGMALAWGKRLIVIGPRENVFHTMPGVLHFWEWGPDVVSALSEPEEPPKVVGEGPAVDYGAGLLSREGVGRVLSEPRGVICGSHYIEVKQPVRECPTCNRRRRFLMLSEAWRGIYWTCLSCGERLHSDEGRMRRPFMPGWRAESIKEAKKFWREHGRVRFSMRRLLMQ